MSFPVHRLPRCSGQNGFVQAPHPSVGLRQPWKTSPSVRWNHEVAGNAIQRKKRIVVAVTGATGAPLTVSLLQHLKALDVETHLIMSKWGSATLKYELAAPDDTPRYLESLATKSYSPYDVSASLSSGSFKTDGMIVVPCSMKTLAAIRIGYDNELISRAASVTLKERRRLVLVARETPLSSIHLENMLEVTRAGAIVYPPVMAFYTRPQSVEEMVQQSVRRMIDALDLDLGDHDARWKGFDWAAKKAVEKEMHV
jgi:4-hydroxy-3-polyprenylbenzoate decarboxylase